MRPSGYFMSPNSAHGTIEFEIPDVEEARGTELVRQNNYLKEMEMHT